MSRAPGTTRVSVQLTHAQARQLVRAAGLVVGTGAGDVRDVRCLAAGAAAIERAFVRQEEKRAERERRRAAGVPAPELKPGARPRVVEPEPRCESQGCSCSPSLPCDEDKCDGQIHDDDGSAIAHCTMCLDELEDAVEGGLT